MTKNFFLNVLFLQLLSVPVSASEISSCKIFKSSSSVSVDLAFDGAFSIKGMVYRGGTLLMPLDGYGDRRYDNIRLLSREVYLLAEQAALKGNCGGPAPYKKPELRVIELSRLKSPGRVANVSFVIGGDFVVVAGIIRRKAGATPLYGHQAPAGNFWVAYPEGFSFLKKEDKAFADALLISHYEKAK